MMDDEKRQQTLQPGQEVGIKNTRHVIGKIVRLRDSDPVGGDIYEVEIDPRHIYLRLSDLEVFEDEPTDSNNPKQGTREWTAEALRAARILQVALDHPDDPIARKAMAETLEKLGLL